VLSQKYYFREALKVQVQPYIETPQEDKGAEDAKTTLQDTFTSVI